MRTKLVLAALGIAALGVLALAPATAEAHPPRFRISFGYSSGGYYPSYGFGSGGYYAAPRYHDVTPHWHRSYTPYGSSSWYGNGPHDYVPHSHIYTPYGKIGQHYHGWGYTESYYPRYRYRYYSPW
jgi:hypothetical protein